MSRVFIDGFESGSTGLWTTNYGATIVTASTYGMTGGYATYCNQNYYLIKMLPSSDEYYVAFLYRHANASARQIIQFFNGTTQVGLLTRNTSTQVLEARYGTGAGFVLASSDNQLLINVVYLIEVHYKPADEPDGRFQVKINGILKIDINGSTTGGPTVIDNIRIGCSVSDTNSWGYYDNIVIDDSEWPGSTFIQRVVPNGIGSSETFTISSLVIEAINYNDLVAL